MLALTTTLSLAQEQKYSARVVDGETGEPLPYVSIYRSKGHGTLTNEEGLFAISANAGDTLSISFIGYEKLRLPASRLKRIVQMRPIRKTLREVTVEATEAIMKKVIRNMTEDYKNRKSAIGTYFFRMTTEDFKSKELAEAFISAHSAINLRDLQFRSGYRGEEDTEGDLRASHMSFTNAHNLLQLGPMVNESSFWRLDFIPLNKATYGNQKNQREYALFRTYDFRHEILISESGDLIYKIPITFKADTVSGKVLKESRGHRIHETVIDIPNALPNEDLSERRVIEGLLYVDSKTYRPLSFSGRVLNFQLNLRMADRDFYEPISMDFHVDYTQENAFTEVKTFSAHLNNRLLDMRILLFNVQSGDDFTKKKKKNSSETGDNMQKSIDDAGFDSTLWTKDIILRTMREEEIVKERKTQERHEK